MKSTILLGLQFGDEGKGKMVDYLSDKFEKVVRSNGGNNAGHTVVHKGTKLALSQIPCGVLQNKEAIIAQGCVISPKVLISEINQVKALGLDLKLLIDARAHIVMPYHIRLDESSELYKGDEKIGSLKLGIGFCYEDRNNREGIRMIDLINPEKLRARVLRAWDLKKARVEKAYNQTFDLDIEMVLKEYNRYGEILKEYVGYAPESLSYDISNKSILIETSQAFYLDYAFGTYPYTVAYNTIASSALPSIGLPNQDLNVIGVFRSYSIRVGNGIFPTELDSELGEKLRKIGNEYGTVSGRPRRCGWLDLPLLRYSVKMNGIKELAITKLDILSNFEEILIANEYRYKDEIIKFPPNDLEDLSHATPEYKKFEGWNEDISNIRKYDELPVNCKKYIEYLEEELQVSINYISVGADREQTVEK